MISTGASSSLESYDPWVVPSPTQYERYGDQMPLSPIELAYQAIQSASVASSDTDDRTNPILDEYSQSSWLISTTSPDPFDDTFPTDESIMEIMSLEDTPWDDGHHHSSFLPKLETIESHLESSFPSEEIENSQTPILIHDVLSEGNLGNISITMPINISVNPEVMENIHIGASCSSDEIQTYTTLFQEFCDVFAWSYKEMPGIDPQIVIHEIKTYPEAKPISEKASSCSSMKSRCY
jgi:hypothetical protein